MQETYANTRDGRKVVAAAGTAERLVSVNTRCSEVTITAESDNTGDIVIGDSTVVASAATRRGVPLVPGASYTIKIEDLYQLWIDADVSSDGVVFVYHF